MRAEIRGAQGVQAGHGGVQYNTWVTGVSGAGVARVAAGPVVAGEIPQEPVAFQPREDLLRALRAGGPGVSVVTALSGLRGVGKTQLAAAFARECAAAGWQLTGWVDARDEATVLAGLAAVAGRLGIAPGADVQDAAAAVRDWLAAGGEACLLVFDNAPDVGAVRRFVPAAGRARVVVTTTGQLAGLGGALVTVGVFSEREGLAFLAERTGLADEAGARVVGEELGWLPLGLAQAGAVIAAQRLPYGVYLERLRAVPVAGYLAAGPGDAYPQGVAEAVLLSLRAAGDEPGHGCRAVMELVSVLSPAGVPRALLSTAAGSGALPGFGGPAGERLVDEAVGRLAGGSLLTFSGDGGSVSAHRLVMRVVRERLAATGGLPAVVTGAARALLDAAEEEDGAWRDPAGVRDLAGQVSALTDCVDGHPGAFSGAVLAGLLEVRLRSVSLLNELADSAHLVISAAEPLAAECERVVGADHPDTLASRHNLAWAYREAGRATEAITLHEKNLADRERVLGADHPRTLQSRNNLALVYREAGRTTEAITLHEKNLADDERLQGADHPDTLIARNNLAVVYRDAGRTAEAITLLEKVLADCERLLGADHPRTLTARNNLARVYLEAGHTAEAITLLEKALAGRERVLGADHPDTLISRHGLGLVYRDAGRTAEAITLLQKALADRERVLGANHPDTKAVRDDLASLTT